MYRMVVADDEEIERSALCAKISRNFPQIEICAQATDGEELLQAIRKYQPDIAIIDIEMPVLTGLEAVGQIRAQNLIPDAKILIYTAYSQFEYARQALRERVDDYILKPVPQKKLIEIISSTLQALQQEREDRKQREQQNRIFSEMKETVRREFMKSIAAPGMTLQQMQRFQFVLGDDILQGMVVAFYISCDQSGDPAGISEQIRQAAARLGSAIRGAGGMEGERTDRNLYAFFPVGGEEENSIGKQQEQIRQVEELIRSSGQPDSIHIRAGIGSVCSGHEGLYESFRESFRLLHTRSGKDAILHMQDQRSRDAARSAQLPVVESRLADLIYRRESDAVQKEIKLAFLKSRSMELSDLQHAVLESIVRVISRLRESIPQEQIKQYAFPSLCMSLEQTGNWSEVRDWYLSLADALAQTVGVSVETDGKKTLYRALQYLRDHYQEDISLEDVANSAGVSPGYLSHLFSEELGINYSSYLAKYRIEKAWQLLQNRDISTNELSGMLGFNSVDYFRKVFKKHTGCTVNEYRSRFD